MVDRASYLSGGEVLTDEEKKKKKHKYTPEFEELMRKAAIAEQSFNTPNKFGDPGKTRSLLQGDTMEKLSARDRAQKAAGDVSGLDPDQQKAYNFAAKTGGDVEVQATSERGATGRKQMEIDQQQRDLEERIRADYIKNNADIATDLIMKGMDGNDATIVAHYMATGTPELIPPALLSKMTKIHANSYYRDIAAKMVVQTTGFAKGVDPLGNPIETPVYGDPNMAIRITTGLQKANEISDLHEKAVQTAASQLGDGVTPRPATPPMYNPNEGAYISKTPAPPLTMQDHQDIQGLLDQMKQGRALGEDVRTTPGARFSRDKNGNLMITNIPDPNAPPPPVYEGPPNVPDGLSVKARKNLAKLGPIKEREFFDMTPTEQDAYLHQAGQEQLMQVGQWLKAKEEKPVSAMSATELPAAALARSIGGADKVLSTGIDTAKYLYNQMFGPPEQAQTIGDVANKISPSKKSPEKKISQEEYIRQQKAVSLQNAPREAVMRFVVDGLQHGAKRHQLINGAQDPELKKQIIEVLDYLGVNQ